MKILSITFLQVFVTWENIIYGILLYSLIPAFIGLTIHFCISLITHKPITKNHFYTFLMIYLSSIFVLTLFLLSLD